MPMMAPTQSGLVFPWAEGWAEGAAFCLVSVIRLGGGHTQIAGMPFSEEKMALERLVLMRYSVASRSFS